MVEASQIKWLMEVRGSDGKHIGTVDAVEGKRVKLASGGMHHYIDLAMVESIEDDSIRLKRTAKETTQTWHPT